MGSERSNDWVLIGAGLTVGLVVGALYAALAVARVPPLQINNHWFSPEVIGPLLGSFSAAIVGVAGAAWVHLSSLRHRERATEQVARAAIVRVMTTTLELCGYMRVFVDELDRGAQGLDFRPHLIEAMRENVSQIAGDLAEVSRSDALRPDFASIARSNARVVANGIVRVRVDTPGIEGTPADVRATLPPEQALVMKRTVAAYRHQLEMMFANMSTWNDRYQLLEPGLSLQEAMAGFTGNFVPIN